MCRAVLYFPAGTAAPDILPVSGGALLAAFVSIMTGWILEHIFHRKWWDYSKNRFQYEGYFSVWHLLVFGAAVVVVMKFSNPLLQQILKQIPHFIGRIILIAAYILMGIDFLGSVVAILQLRIKIRRIMQLNDHYLYLAPDLYEELFGGAPDYNQLLMKYQDTSSNYETALGEKS